MKRKWWLSKWQSSERLIFSHSIMKTTPICFKFAHSWAAHYHLLLKSSIKILGKNLREFDKRKRWLSNNSSEKLIFSHSTMLHRFASNLHTSWTLVSFATIQYKIFSKKSVLSLKNEKATTAKTLKFRKVTSIFSAIASQENHTDLLQIYTWTALKFGWVWKL